MPTEEKASRVKARVMLSTNHSIAAQARTKHRTLVSRRCTLRYSRKRAHALTATRTMIRRALSHAPVLIMSLHSVHRQTPGKFTEKPPSQKVIIVHQHQKALNMNVGESLVTVALDHQKGITGNLFRRRWAFLSIPDYQPPLVVADTYWRNRHAFSYNRSQKGHK